MVFSLVSKILATKNAGLHFEFFEVPLRSKEAGRYEKLMRHVAK